jgi:alpha-beta hydrolase superfamily lysophospholipase
MKALSRWAIALFLFFGLLIAFFILTDHRVDDYDYPKKSPLTAADKHINATYRIETIPLADDYEGKVVATLLFHPAKHPSDSAVLFIHGYSDYFFHDHVAQWFNNQGFDFYAIELRKYGRSWLPHQKPNYCRDLSEYYPELDAAITRIRTRDQHHFLAVAAHSTGGLTATLYAGEGKNRSGIQRLILDSPFFGFNTSPVASFAVHLYGALGQFHDKGVLPVRGGGLYGKAINKKYGGEWDYNFYWKPFLGFPFHQSWVRAILAGQEKVDQGLKVDCPVLVLHSDKTYTGQDVKMAKHADVVLDVADISGQAKKIRGRVKDVSIPDAVHDVFLSEPQVRKKLFTELATWLKEQ